MLVQIAAIRPGAITMSLPSLLNAFVSTTAFVADGFHESNYFYSGWLKSLAISKWQSKVLQTGCVLMKFSHVVDDDPANVTAELFCP